VLADDGFHEARSAVRSVVVAVAAVVVEAAGIVWHCVISRHGVQADVPGWTLLLLVVVLPVAVVRVVVQVVSVELVTAAEVFVGENVHEHFLLVVAHAVVTWVFASVTVDNLVVQHVLNRGLPATTRNKAQLTHDSTHQPNNLAFNAMPFIYKKLNPQLSTISL
jgi:hypothetical protein